MIGLFDRTVVWLTWRQLFARKRLYLAVAFSLLPLIFTVFFKFAADDQPGSRLAFFSGLSRELIIGTLVPLAAALFGTTAFGGEVDDGTLVYLLVKPIPRWRIVLSKYVVAVLSTIGVMIPAMVLPWFLLSGPELSARVLRGFLVGGAAGAAIYCALFLSLGLASKRALVLSLLYVIGFEAVLSRNLVGVKSLSVREFAVALSQAASSGAIVLKGYVVPMTTVWTMSGILLIGAMALSLRKLSRYELAERV
jgi:ABC-2 type transport system permease protein